MSEAEELAKQCELMQLLHGPLDKIERRSLGTIAAMLREQEQTITRLERGRERWSLALQSLTPGGSEYVADPDRCVAFVRETRQAQHETILNRVKDVKRLERERDEAYEHARSLQDRLTRQIEGNDKLRRERDEARAATERYERLYYRSGEKLDKLIVLAREHAAVDSDAVIDIVANGLLATWRDYKHVPAARAAMEGEGR